MEQLGKGILITGLVLAAVGLVLWKFHHRLPLGHLPGDISVQKGNYSFYFPLTTCIVISIVLTLLMWLFRK
jgi:hypothetical protein